MVDYVKYVQYAKVKNFSGMGVSIEIIDKKQVSVTSVMD